MASIVTFSSVIPIGSVVDQATNVAETASLVLRIKPEIGNGIGGNGGSTREAARPAQGYMLDGAGFVLPQYVRLYKVSSLNGTEISGTDVPLNSYTGTSAFFNGRPSEPVYFDMEFKPAQKLDAKANYAFEYTESLPADWVPREQIDYDYALANPTINTSGSGNSGLGF